MTKTVLAEGESGAIVAYEGTTEERSARIEAWAKKAAADLSVTPGQAALLRRLHRDDAGGKRKA